MLYDIDFTHGKQQNTLFLCFIVETTWDNIIRVYKDTAESVLGFRKKKDKEWITPETTRR